MLIVFQRELDLLFDKYENIKVFKIFFSRSISNDEQPDAIRSFFCKRKDFSLFSNTEFSKSLISSLLSLIVFYSVVNIIFIFLKSIEFEQNVIIYKLSI